MDAPSSAAVIRCTGDVGLRTCDATHAALTAALATHDEVVVDCTEARDVDVGFVQMLISARRTADASGQRLRLSAPADGALLEVLVRGGFLDPQHAGAGAEAALWAGITGESR
jgi:anti-anti-sigma regulatory factor